ncbi:MAG: ankyrin repeat domain-containing protein [Alphaproteobacteria bacterium]|nr:ankyrin repeat domain-containing protein [Alphaproteobacteria bacterium]
MKLGHKTLLMLSVLSTLCGCGDKEYNYNDIICNTDNICYDKKQKPITGIVKKYNNEVLEKVVLYKDGKRNGKFTSYFPSGGIEIEANYIDGVLNGNLLSKYENGEVKEELNLSNGKNCKITNVVNIIQTPDKSDYLKKLNNEKIKILENDDNGIVVGPDDAKVVITEFFDFYCPYSKKLFPVLNSLIQDNPDVKFVFRPLETDNTYTKKAIDILIASQNGKNSYEVYKELMEIDFNDSDLDSKLNHIKEKFNLNSTQPDNNTEIVPSDKAVVKNQITNVTSLIINGFPLNILEKDDIQKIINVFKHIEEKKEVCDVYANSRLSFSEDDTSDKKSKIDYTFDMVIPGVRGACKGFGCIIADLESPGGRKRTSDKYDGKNILIKDFHIMKFNDNYDSITYYDISEILPCIMSIEESEKLEKATKGEKVSVSIYGTLNIGKTNPYLEPCYFKELYRCKENEDRTTCLKSADTLANIEWLNGRTFEDIEKEINSGANINSKNNEGKTALILATTLGNKEFVEFLVSKGADVDAKNNDGYTAFFLALLDGYKEIAELLLSKGTNINVIANDGNTTLMSASGRGYKEIVELLLSKGADINAKSKAGFTALMFASLNGKKEVVELLLSKGADINANDDVGTALIMASLSGKKEVVELLLSKGADINAKASNNGYTALTYASSNGHKEIVELLLSKGADINAKDDNGDTALMKASYDGKKEIVELLLSKGADVNAESNYGSTAMLYAVTKGYDDIAEIIRQNGVKKEYMRTRTGLLVMRRH